MRTLICLTMVILPLTCFASEVKHVLSCKISTYSAIEVLEGKLKHYGTPNEFEIGEFFRLELISGWEHNNWLPIKIWLGEGSWELASKKKNLLSRMYMRAEDIESFDGHFIAMQLELPEAIFRGKLSMQASHLYVNENYLTAQSGFSTLRLSRYYKGDWSGLLDKIGMSVSGGLTSQTYTLDCRTIQDGLNEIIERVDNAKDASTRSD